MNDDTIRATFLGSMDVGAVAVTGAAIYDFLPKISIVLSVVWFAIQIWESRTGKQVRQAITDLIMRIF